MFFKKYTVLLYLVCVVETILFYGMIFGNQVDKSLETALKLDTGFDYPTYDELCNLSILECNNKILAGEQYLENVELMYKTTIICNDLYCSNIFNYLQYLALFFFTTIPPSPRYDINRITLNESITKQFLVTMIKLDFSDKQTIFWMIHLFNKYIQLFGNDIHQYGRFIYPTLEIVYNSIKYASTQICRKNNKYEVYNIPSNDSEKYSTLMNLIDVMNRRKEINKIVLRNTEEQENSFSLRSIYLCDIIENKELLRTVIIDFGEQSEDTFEAIYNEIYEAYTTAKNYFWFNVWMKQIGIYQKKLLNVFKTVLMHLVRKGLMYSSLMLKKKNVINAKNSLRRMHYFVNHIIILFEGQEFHDVQKVLNSFDELPTFTENFNLYFIVVIPKIESIINEIKSNSFNLILNNLISEPGYESTIHDRTKKYISEIVLSVNEINTIKNLETFTDDNDINMNLVRIYSFIKLIERSFQNVNLKTILSYSKFTEFFQIFGSYSDNNRENYVRLLEL